MLIAWFVALGQGTKVPPDRPPSESERDHPQERAKWFLRGRTVDGRPAAAELHRAHQQRRENRRLHAMPAGRQATGTQSALSSEMTTPGASAPAPSYVQSTGGPSWVPLGPAPTATAAYNNNQQDYGPAVGRATAVAVDQSDSSGNTVYVGGASGGLWKSINAGPASARSCNGNGVCTASPTWVPLIDTEATLAVGFIALQPGNSNLILVGTGEANNSADSYYGLGFLRSTDGGASWAPIISSATCPPSTPPCPPSGTISFHGLGFTHVAFSTDNPLMVAATAAAASGGITVGAETAGSNARGIYYSSDAGQSWTRANVWDAPGIAPAAGSANAVIYNSAQHKFYANLRYHGIYVSSDGITFNRLGSSLAPGTTQPGGSLLSLTACPSALPATPACPLYRAEMAAAPGRDEMYVWIVDSSDNDNGIFQTTNGGNTWTPISTSGIDNCSDGSGNGCGTGTSSQATYNITLAAIPNGTTATDLYAGGVNQYKCTINPSSNPTCATNPFVNLTHVYGCTPAGSFAHVHPDEHGIDFLRANPAIMYFANDGGIYRTLNSFSNQSQTCNGTSQPWIQFDNLNATMGSMIQFVWFSQHPSDPATLFGGTQDNGSPGVSGTSPSSGNWISINNGDGGFNDINPLNPTEWFTSNTYLDPGGGIQRCTNGISCTWDASAGGFSSVVIQSDVGGDNSPFYTDFMLDPQAATRLMVGTCRVWRGNSDGTGTGWSNNGGVALSYNFDTLDNTACASSAQNMVTALAAGGPCNGTSCNSTPANPTGGGSQVIWAGTDGDNTNQVGGQVWVTTNADGGPTTWLRRDGAGQPACTATASACNINPRHYPISGIAVDPHDATGRTAYVTIMGFGAGHVFKTTDAGATWALLDGAAGGTGLPDNPADAVVVDPITTNLVYVATDVGVFKSTGDGNWTELGPGTGAGALPNVATTALKIYKNGSDMRLRVSTYGRGIWEILLTGFSLSVPTSMLFTFPGQNAVFDGTVSGAFNYNYTINLSCQPGATGTPPTCTTNPASLTTAGATTPVTVTTAGSLGDFSFNLQAQGTDPQTLTQQVPLTLHVVDFTMGPVPPATVGASDAANVNFDVSAQGAFTGDVTLTCSGQPAGSSCNFSPSVASLTPGKTVSVSLIIPTSASTTTGSYTVTITGTATIGTATQIHTTTMSLTVKPQSDSFAISASSSISPTPIKPGQSLSAGVNVTSNGTYQGDVAVGCAFDPAAGDPGTSTCLMNPNSVSLTQGGTLPSTLSVNTVGAVAGNPRVIVTAIDANNASSSVRFDYSVMDYALTASAPGVLVPGGSIGVNLSLAGLNGFSSTVAMQCNAPSPLTCLLNPGGPYAVSATAVPVTATIAAPTGTTPTGYTVNVNSNDAAYPALVHNRVLNISVQDFQVTANPTANTIKAGASSTHMISITGLGGFAAAVNLSVSAGCPQLTTCSLSPSSIMAGASTTLTITTTAPSVASMRPPSGRRGMPLYALWAIMPGVALGLITLGGGSRAKRGRLLAGIGLTLALTVLLMLPACGGGGSGSTSPPVPKPGTPPGTYTIVVTGTSGSGAATLSRSAQIALTVQ